MDEISSYVRDAINPNTTKRFKRKCRDDRATSNKADINIQSSPQYLQKWLNTTPCECPLIGPLKKSVQILYNTLITEMLRENVKGNAGKEFQLSTQTKKLSQKYDVYSGHDV